MMRSDMFLLRMVARYPLTVFFTLAYSWTWVCWWSIVGVSTGQWNSPVSTEILATLGQFGPFASALVVVSATGGRKGVRQFMSRFARWRAHPTWFIVSLSLIPLLMLTAIVMHACANGTLATLQFRDTWATLPAHFVYTLLLCGPLGEEPGWRGFALPRLQDRYGPVLASLWLGALWAGWHLPLWWINPSPPPYLLYVASAIPMTFLFTWLFQHTYGSVLYALFFHASMNTAGMRLPEVPAHIAWVACLFAAAIIILRFDPRMRPLHHRKVGCESGLAMPATETRRPVDCGNCGFTPSDP